jgi:hypothetical protein
MARLKAVGILQGLSGIPRDQYENTFHFQTPSGDSAVGTQAEYATAAARVANFYTGASAGGGAGVAGYFSNAILTVATVKVYDYAGGAEGASDVDTGPPVFVASFIVEPSQSGAQGLPEEIALCLSYYSTSNTPRHRGRIYLGPWADAVLTSAIEPRPSSGLLLAMVTAGTRLSADGTSAQSTGGLTPIIPATSVPAAVDGVNWYLRSRVGTGTPSSPVPSWERIEKGWVDNGWDSQRRRGVAASARVTFPS